jgi:predicted AAA+ superfamily ATPase
MLDEIHKYPNWSQELKTIYDTLPALNVVFSGSTIIRLMDGEADLSRRALMTRLDGLSFREYLQILLDIELPILSLNDILNNHIDISHELCARFRPLQYFGEYLKSGYYPYSLQSKDTYLLKLASVIGFVIDTEMNVLSPLDARGMHKMRRLLKLISTGLPYVPNISQLSAALELNRITILNYLSLLEKTELTNNVYASGSFYGQLTKPGKVLLANTNLAYALSNDQVNSGAIRETFVVNQLRSSHIVELAGKADFKVDEQFVLEVGGRSKSKKQIAGVSNAFLVTDDREYGFNNQIPLWLFGFLY